MDLQFELMTEKYGKEVIDIFNYYIKNSYSTYFEKEIPYQFFAKFLEMTKGYPAFIIKKENSDRVIGFCFLKAYSPLPVFKGTAEITYFIEKDEVGNGIGRKALELLERESKKIGIKYILASISSYNEQSFNFHQKNGFIECGRFKNIGSKREKNFDVVWMEKDII